MEEQRIVYFSGHVQGVGFRFTTQGIAKNFDVTGYVRNLPDGRVEIVVEGRSSDIDSFLDQVRTTMATHIDAIEEATGRATGSFDSFGVRH